MQQSKESAGEECASSRTGEEKEGRRIGCPIKDAARHEEFRAEMSVISSTVASSTRASSTRAPSTRASSTMASSTRAQPHHEFHLPGVQVFRKKQRLHGRELNNRILLDVTIASEKGDFLCA